MSIEKMRFDDLPISTTGRRPPNPETVVVLSLQPGEAMRCDCRWKHSPRNRSKCSGVTILRNSAKRAGWTAVVVYVGRPA